MDYLFALTESLNRDPSIQRHLCYRPNSSLYRTAGRLRYAEARLDGKVRAYHLVAVEENEYLLATLARAEKGAMPGELAAALVAADPEITLAEAESYISELIASQLLVPDLAPAVTGREPVHGLIDLLNRAPATQMLAQPLMNVRTELAQLDVNGLGNAADCYHAIAQHLHTLPAPVELARLFQVDMVKPAPAAVLGRASAVARIKEYFMFTSSLGVQEGAAPPRAQSERFRLARPVPPGSDRCSRPGADHMS